MGKSSSECSSGDERIGHICFDGKDVLEIGSGYGDFTLTYLVGAGSLLCIEPDEEAVESLKLDCATWPRPGRVRVLKGKIEDVTLPAEAFDVAVFCHSF
jgi:predicted RNA methylase